MATGLAWTRTGGEIVFVEATKMHGGGQLTLTGSLGTVMKESAQAAMSYIRATRTGSASPIRFSPNTTSTSTFRPVPFPRTAPRPG